MPLGWRRWTLYAGLSITAWLVALWLARSGSEWLGATAKARQVFELFGFTESLVLLAIAWLEHRRRPLSNLRRAVVVLAPLALSFLVLTILVEAGAEKSWDYQCYERAARALRQGENPYQGTGYLYPPLTAELLAGIHGLVAASHGGAVPGQARWFEVFYLFQSTQLFLVQLTCLLLFQLFRQLGLGGAKAMVFAVGLLAVNNPLVRTLEFNQVNLWVLVPLLVALVGVGRAPWLTGLLLAFGAHVKLYPLLLVGALGVLGRLKALVAALLGTALLFAGQLWLGHAGTAWPQFLVATGDFPATALYRDNSPRGVATMLARELAPWAGPWLPWLVGTASLAVVAWLGSRFLRRRRQASGSGSPALAARELETATLVDAVAAMLLLSPMVWEHHYVLALPLAAHALATRRHLHPRAVWLGTALLFALPTFDVFLASWHRLAGLLLLLWATEPRPTQARPAGAAPASAQ